MSKVNSIIEGLSVSRTGTITEGTDISEAKKVMKASDELDDFMYKKAKKGMKFVFNKDYKYGPMFNNSGNDITDEEIKKYKLKGTPDSVIIPKGTVAVIGYIGNGGSRGGVEFDINGLSVEFTFFSDDAGDLELVSDEFNNIDEAKKKVVRCPKCNSTDVEEWEKGVYFCNTCQYEFDDKDLKSGYIRESGIVGNNVKLILKDARGNSCSISNLIEVGNRYNFGEKEFMNVIRDCKRSPKDIANALNSEKDWLVASFETMGNGEGTDSGCTLRATDSLKNKYMLYIKY